MAETPHALSRVLLLEGDPAVRQGLESLLAKEGVQVVPVAHWREAAEVAQREAVDLLLLNMELGDGFDGLTYIREFKSVPGLNWVPILFYSARTRPQEILPLFEAGADEYLTKPLKGDELLVRAKVLMRKGRETRWLADRARKLSEKIAERDDELDDLRRFAQDIVGSLPSALMVLDTEGTILYVNAPLVEWLWTGRRDLVGHKIGEFVHEEKLGGAWARALEAATKHGQPSRLPRVAGFLKGKEDRISDLTVTPLDYAGVRQVLVVVEDETEQARAEAAVNTERRKLNDIVNALSAALCLIGRDRQVLWKNKMFDAWFGEAAGQPGLAAFQAGLQSSDAWVWPVFGNAKVQQLDWWSAAEHGQARRFGSIIAPVKEEGDKPVEQALVLTQDMTDQETRAEQLAMLRDLSQYLQRTLDAARLNHVILLCVTAGHALGFNRAFLFRRQRGGASLAPVYAVGPTSREEAYRIWNELSAQRRSLLDLVSEVEQQPREEVPPLLAPIRGLTYGLDNPAEIIVRAALEKKTQHVVDAEKDERVTPDFRQRFGGKEFVAVPLISKNTVVGVLLADNVYSGRPITADQINLLDLFAAQAALAIENADTHAALQASLSELRAAQEQNVRAQQLVAVGEMANHVAHEIRNPLTTIGGFARALLKKPENVERVKQNAAIIAQEATRLENMLKGVMDFSRPASPVLQLGDFNAVVERAFRTHVDGLSARNIHAGLDLDPSLPELSFDENQVLQLLANLLRNAQDSMPQGGALMVQTHREGDMAVLRVTDTGTGIAPDVMERMFSPFYTTKPDGTGLGLAVSKKIVDGHGGRIECKSELGKGTTFLVCLPLKRPRVAPVPAPAGQA